MIPDLQTALLDLLREVEGSGVTVIIGGGLGAGTEVGGQGSEVGDING